MERVYRFLLFDYTHYSGKKKGVHGDVTYLRAHLLSEDLSIRLSSYKNSSHWLTNVEFPAL